MLERPLSSADVTGGARGDNEELLKKLAEKEEVIQ